VAHVIVWEFRIRPEAEAEFIAKYGPDGIWARFFRRGQGYIRTELVRDVADRGRYLTLDYWHSEEEFKRFREQNQAEYRKIDEQCEQLTQSETCLGNLLGQPDRAEILGARS
jgi:heme-degrading monooxygenase HmoA